MNQYEKTFRDICKQIIDLSPEMRLKFLKENGFLKEDATIEDCTPKMSKEEMLLTMEELAHNLQDEDTVEPIKKVHTKIKKQTISCFSDNDFIIVNTVGPMPLTHFRGHSYRRACKRSRTGNRTRKVLLSASKLKKLKKRLIG